MGVPVGKEAKFHGMMQLNDVGYDIVSLMTEEISRDELIDKVLEKYDTDRETASLHVDNVIAYLEEQGVITNITND